MASDISDQQREVTRELLLDVETPLLRTAGAVARVEVLHVGADELAGRINRSVRREAAQEVRRRIRITLIQRRTNVGCVVAKETLSDAVAASKAVDQWR